MIYSALLKDLKKKAVFFHTANRVMILFTDTTIRVTLDSKIVLLTLDVDFKPTLTTFCSHFSSYLFILPLFVSSLFVVFGSKALCFALGRPVSAVVISSSWNLST